MTGMTEFRTIMIDPPWPENGGGKIKRGADRHYKTMKVRHIAPVILGCHLFRPAPASHLYMWATNNYLPDALTVVKDIGFRYVTTITWAKDRAGLGQYFRGQTEQLIFAVRGRGYDTKTERKDLTTLIQAPRGRHSRKPDKAFELVEARSVGPYLEMFGRGEPRKGWTIWGDEAEESGEPEKAREHDDTREPGTGEGEATRPEFRLIQSAGDY